MTDDGASRRRFLLGTGVAIGTAGLAGCGIPGGGGEDEEEEGGGGEGGDDEEGGEGGEEEEEEDEEEQLQAPESQ
jgi:hypothetical protein